ncbi:MAG: nucleoside-diphosphate kinase [Candidatus Falkowbacteria bacterium]
MKTDNVTKNLNEICLVLMRPDVFQSGKFPEALLALSSLENIEIVHVKTMTPNRELLEKHYKKDEAWLTKVGIKTIELLLANKLPANLGALSYGQQVLKSLIDYNTEGTIVAVLLRGLDACNQLRELVGHTNPAEAAPGTLRARYSTDSFEKANLEIRAVRNGFHCSESDHDGLMEASLFFPEFKITDLIKG